MKKTIKLALLVLLLVPVGVFLIKQQQQLSKIQGVKTAIEENQQQNKIDGIILPHHNLAKAIIIDSYQKLSQEQFELIVLIGPNHFYPKIGEIISSKVFDNAQLQTADWLINTLLDNDLIKLNQAMLASEHSILTHSNYLNEFFPEAEILPLVIPVNPDPNKMRTIRDFLVNLPTKTLFIASVDFAHNLSYLEALENNQESLEAIQGFAYEKINSFDDQHLDSPKSIILLLEIMKEKGSTNFQVLHNTHSALIDQQINSLGTSYLIGTFQQ